MQLVESRKEGLYCTVGDFYIDPILPVKKAWITHAHADHYCSGCEAYFGHDQTIYFLKKRIGRIAPMTGIPYGEKRSINGVEISLHSAGHIPGSALIRLEYQGEVWVITGDFNPPGSVCCAPFTQLQCDYLITECTFSHPKFVWPAQDLVFNQVQDWYETCINQQVVPILTSYSLGKAQKVQLMCQTLGIPYMVHQTVEKFNQCYRDLGFEIPDVSIVKDGIQPRHYEGQLIIAPPTVLKTAWLYRFNQVSTALCSGWVLQEGMVQKRGANVGFCISDHADFPDLVRHIKRSQADVVYLMHGDKARMASHLGDFHSNIKLLEYQ